jgi:hypothetical protein
MCGKLLSAAALVVVVAAAMTGAATAGQRAGSGSGAVHVVLRPRVVDLFHSASVRVTGIAAHSVQVRLVGAIDRSGRAYEWKPYHWRSLRAHHSTWGGALPPPPLFGIYRLQLRLDQGRKFLSSARWLLRVLPSGTMKRRPSTTATGAVRRFVVHLPRHEILVALRQWPLAKFDHRDPRLNRLFVVAYRPRSDHGQSSRVGQFISTVRDGYRGGWRVLEATTQPYG